VGIPDFSIPVQRAVDRGLAAAAVLDVDGKPFAVAGALDDDEVRAVAGLVTCRLRSPDLLDRMLEGEMVTSSLDDREVSIGIAGRCVFVVVVLASGVDLSRILSRILSRKAVHHADVIAIEGDSYRRRDAETDKKSRRAKKQAA
jgi:hypothetical protein